MQAVNDKNPDFIIIGAMKCATSSLHEQLVRQPGFFLTTPKEPNFFSDDAVYARGIGWYRALFDDARPGDLKGESSTHYTKLPTLPRTIDRMCEHGLDNLKLIYMIRHPVDRLISHYIHEWSQGIISTDIDTAIGKHPELVAYSRYDYQVTPWLETFGKERVQLVFFDHFREQPQRELERVCRFLGYDHQPQWRDDVGAQNVSAQRIRKFPMYDLLIESRPMVALRRNFVPKALRTRVRERLTMQTRPSIDEAVMRELVGIFDADLACLGEKLGLSLNCDNFKAVGAKTEPEWVPSPGA